jgi:hypothetical protein
MDDVSAKWDVEAFKLWTRTLQRRCLVETLGGPELPARPTRVAQNANLSIVRPSQRYQDM